jgi:hypothetical protein
MMVAIPAGLAHPSQTRERESKFEVGWNRISAASERETSTMSEKIDGVVRNGVIVPDERLPEGARVSIVLQPHPPTFTPEERAEFEAWNRVSDKALERVDQPTIGETTMSEMVTTEPRITIATDVLALLKERNAEKRFSDLLALIRECFPQALSLDVYLQGDCTEPTCIRVVIDVYFPTNATETERLLEQWGEFDQQLVARIPVEYPPLFLVMRRYSVNK